MSSGLFAVTVIGKDRPGIVAGITRALFELGCNLEDVTSTIMSGHFAMVLLVRSSSGSSVTEFEDKLGAAAEPLGLQVWASSVDDSQGPVGSPTHMISVYGADHPGIVYRVTEALAASDVNITDLTSRIIGSEESPVYALMLEVVAPPGRNLEALLQELKDGLEVDISVHPIEADVL